MSKIWIINQFANTPDMPGGTRHYEIAKYFSDIGWDVEVFSSDFNLSRRKFMKIDKFKLCKTEEYSKIKWHWLITYPYQTNNWKRYLNLVSFCLNMVIKQIELILNNSLSDSNPDIIIASSPQLPASFICLIIAKLLRKKFIFEVRDLWPQVLIDMSGFNKRNIFIRFLFWIEEKLYKNASCVVILAKGAKNYVLAKGAKRIIWLPNGSDLAKFSPLSYPNENCNFNKKNPFIIIYAGAHGIANDLSNVIEAAKLLINDPIKFVFIGDGPTKNDLIIQAQNLNNVSFLQAVSKDLIPKKMSEANAILISLADIKLFQYGISPNKLYDAYALARPVISTLKGSINNEIESLKLGLTSNPGKPKDLADTIRKMYRLPKEEREKMGLRSRKLAEDIYSRDRIKKLYSSLIVDILKNND